ncbi:hypothetical protein BS50DRAFT_105066 [Corynespora cassiicola Philippines]|uniref:Uncharacterized protein n=1 Tax=Corynespora cassiicola Philippines TaxID=1448308 RepID=A0A2T2NCP4_CORCC|nr:hypothetical protein BS50DRAFT_105066 [Corynespora cassiicola Philippines]
MGLAFPEVPECMTWLTTQLGPAKTDKIIVEAQRVEASSSGIYSRLGIPVLLNYFTVLLFSAFVPRARYFPSHLSPPVQSPGRSCGPSSLRQLRRAP